MVTRDQARTVGAGSGPTLDKAMWGLLVLYGALLLLVPSDVGPSMLGIVLSPSRLVLLILTAAAVITGRLNVAICRTLPRSVVLGWIAFLGAAAASVALHPGSAQVARLGSMALEGVVLFVAAYAIIKGGEVRSDRVAIGLAAVTLVLAGVTMALAVMGGDYQDLFAAGATGGPVLRLGIERQAGSFASPLFLAIWLVAASILLLPLTEGRGWRRWAAAAGWLVLALAIVATVSRAAIVAAPAMAGAFYLMRSHHRLAALLLGVAIILAAGLAAVPTLLTPAGVGGSPPAGIGGSPTISPLSTTPPVNDQAALLNGSGELRMAAVTAALKASLEEPLFGWGLLAEKGVVSAAAGGQNYVDSSYLAYLVDIGWVGTTAFVALLLAVLAAAIRRPLTATSTALALAMLAIVGLAALAAFFSITQGYAAFWLLAAAATAAASVPASTASPRGPGVGSSGPPL